jgi:muramoyltetrapeptide carboxypeptidase LdcA involved in peptidoglycan recycling
MDPSRSRDYAPTVQKPRRLHPGDVAAIASPSWGGPAAFPATYEAGLRVLRDLLGLRIRELPHARDAAASPRERADDLNSAFRDPEVRLVLASIGGDDSILVLPHLDAEAARRDPKIVMGYSDTTTLLVWLARLGVVSFHGPSVMAGLAQAPAFPEAFLDHVRRVLFDAEAVTYAPFGAFCEGYADWGYPSNAGRTNPLQPDAGPRWLQGHGTHAGPLLGGCIEVLEFLRGTPWLPLDGATWDGRVLFFETSEEAPPPRTVKRMLRSYGTAGVFDRVAAVLVGRPRDYPDDRKRALDEVVLEVIAGECGRTELPVVTNLDFGHTDPQWILPLGARLEVDCEARTLRLLEPAVD